jgi:hypothetical protein
MLDLGYLNKYAGEIVRVGILTDTTSACYNTDGHEFFGQITDGNYDQMATFFQGNYKLEVFNLEKKIHTPYIGPTETLWDIEKVDGQTKLLTHNKIGENEYLIIGPGGIEMGIIKGLEIPYRTIYWKLQSEMDKNVKKQGADYTVEMEKRNKAFKEWKKSLFK